MQSRWGEDLKAQFIKDSQLCLDYYEVNKVSLKSSSSDLIAVCFILLVGSYLGIPKSDFLEC